MDIRSSYGVPRSAPPIAALGGVIPAGTELAINRLHAAFIVEGSASIRRLTPLPKGGPVTLRFTGTPTFVNSASLICPNSVDYTAGSGDLVFAVPEGNGVWRLLVLAGQDAKEGIVSVHSYGAKGDGTIDDTAAVQAAVNASNYLYFPPGKYKLTSPITKNLGGAVASFTVVGAGADNTILFWPSGNGIIVNYANQQQSVHARDLSFTTGAITANIGLELIQTGSVAGGDVMAYSDLFRVTFRGDDGYQLTDFWTTAIEARGISSLNLDTVFIQGPSTPNGNGVDYAGLTSGSTYAVVLNVAKSVFNNLATGLIYGSFVQGVSVDQTNFTGCTTGVTNESSALGSLSQLAISNSQFGQFTAGNSIYTSVPISQVLLSNNTFITTSGTFSSSAVFLSEAANYTITGNAFTGSGGANSSGIVIGTQQTSTAGTIVGNIIGGYNVGITLQANSDRANIQGNQFIANVTAAISNSSTGQNRIENNQGYNPVGSGNITVGASPFTYAAGPSPETVYIFGGTVSNVSLTGGVWAATASPCQLYLGPNESITVTYSAAPNMSKMVH